MKYYYSLDIYNRFVRLGTEKILEEDLEIELDNIENIKIGYHGLKNGEIIFIGQVEEEKIKSPEMIKAEKQEKIQNLILLLQNSDYKVIVNQELIASGQEPRYEPIQLHQQRQAWRDEINELEEEIL